MGFGTAYNDPIIPLFHETLTFNVPRKGTKRADSLEGSILASDVYSGETGERIASAGQVIDPLLVESILARPRGR